MRCEIVERVPSLVHQRVDVVRNANGVHEDEWLAAEAQLRAVAARCLTLPALEIQQPFGRHGRELGAEHGIDATEDRFGAVDERGDILERAQRLHTLQLDAEVPRPNAIEPEALASI